MRNDILLMTFFCMILFVQCDSRKNEATTLIADSVISSGDAGSTKEGLPKQSVQFTAEELALVRERNGADSVTIIGKDTVDGKTLYQYIVYRKKNTESDHIDFLADYTQEYNEQYAQGREEFPDAKRLIDEPLQELMGHWSKVTKHDGDYYTFSDCAEFTMHWLVSDTTITPFFMDGPSPVVLLGYTITGNKTVIETSRGKCVFELIEPNKHIYHLNTFGYEGDVVNDIHEHELDYIGEDCLTEDGVVY